MKLELNTIARLNNDEKYIILNEIAEDGKNYFLTMGIIKDNEIDSSKVVILEELKDDEGYYVEKVIDSDLLLKLTKLFKDQM
ncbi:MAG: hypothetical protein IKX00_01075 [Bacilli bacterium]|nr:hypothetical protein [Bacilli bacterium]